MVFFFMIISNCDWRSSIYVYTDAPGRLISLGSTHLLSFHKFGKESKKKSSPSTLVFMVKV